MIENENRRLNLFAKLDDESVTVIFSGVSKVASEDEYFPFKVNQHFFYLTNIKQENSVLMLIKSIKGNKTYLFVDEYDELKEKWTGKRLTYQEAKELSNIQSIYSTKDFETMFELALANENNQYGNISTLYLDFTPELKIKNRYSTLDLKEAITKKCPNLIIKDIYPLVTELRMVKSEWEVDQIKNAIHITNCGIHDLLAKMREGMYEYELSDNFEFYGRANGNHGLAFPTITAGGKNGVILHYPQQQEKVHNGDLILFDLGFETNGYSADISRTFPLNGKYNEIQRKIYQVVLNCNKAVIEYAHAGLTIKDLQNYTVEFLKNECVSCGLLKPEDDIRKVYYHNISHHLGLDTHDASNRDLPLVPGNIITVEPGLYFKEYGVGVRVEDDILITSGKSEVLSSEILKEIDEIEDLLRSKK